MKTEASIAADRECDKVSMEVHIVEAMELLRCVEHYCRTAKPYFDCGSHSHRLKSLIIGLRGAVKDASPEYAKEMLDDTPKFPSAPNGPREIHHHHYHEPRRLFTHAC